MNDPRSRRFPAPRAGAIAIVAALGVVTIPAGGALGGDPDPPPGPIAPTMKDLDDVEPRAALRNDFDTLTPIVISSSGSYYLAENIDAFFGQHGIEITADDVTLDLNGFRILGNTEVGSLDGVHLTSGTKNVTIRNGTIEFFFGDGINALQSQNLTVEGVRLYANGDDGLQSGERTIVRACAASDNFNYGFRVGAFSVVTDSTAADNTTWIGFSASIGATFRGCTAHANGDDGFSTGSYATVENCVADTNSGDGFDLANGSSITNCTARQNTNDGIHSSGPGTITGCTARFNGDDGISVVFTSVISDCASSENSGHGIRAGSSSRVSGNTSNGNDGAGIYVPSLASRGRIEGNTVSSNDIGIDIDGDENIIIGNTATNNSTAEYSISAGNSYGGIINVAGTGAFATDQGWANFIY